MEGKKSVFSKPFILLITAVFCNLLWGSAFPCINIGYDWFDISKSDSATQVLFAGIRFMIAGILVIIAGSFIEKKVLIPKKENIKYVIFLCLFQTVGQYIFFYIGMAHTPSVNASILEGACIFFTILIACYVFRVEKMTGVKAIGCLFGFMGIVIVNLNGSSLSFGFSFEGEGMILISAVCAATSSSLIKIFSKRENTVTMSGYQFLIGGSIMIFLGLLFGGRIQVFGVKQGLLLMYLSFISACAYTLWGLLLKANPISKVSIYSTFNPIFGVILSIILLKNSNNSFGIYGFIALLMVISGIFIINKFEKGNENGKTKLETR